jgi:hypothetical protein
MNTNHVRPWYEEESDEDIASNVDGTAHTIQEAQSGHFHEMLRNGSLYLNRDMMALSTEQDGDWPRMPQQIRNVARAICDQVIAKHVESETKVSFSVEDGDFGAHQAAEDMDRFCWGEFERTNLYWKGEQAFRDSCWAGDGWLKFYQHNGRVAVDRVVPWEVLIDEASAFGTETTEMYQRRYVPRAWAIRAFADQRDLIESLPACTPPYRWPNTEQDVVQLTEAWHLASDEGENDGLHVICCGNVPIVVEPYKHTTFPFARISWGPPLVGAYAISLIAELLPLQLELGKLDKRIQHSLHLMSVPRFWQQAQTKISPEYDNRIGNVYKYTGQKPEQDVGIAVSPELYKQADNLVQAMYSLAHTNPMQAGDMPSRYDSRPALREAQEITDQPHAWVGQRWQRMFVECGKQVIRVAREIVAEHGSYKTFGKARGFVEEIDWADCNLDDNQFVIKPTPSSLLPTTVTGKRLVVEDMFQKQLITDPADAWALLAGMPDVDAIAKEKTSQKRLVEKQLDMMIRKGRDVMPDECIDPNYAKQRAQSQLQLLLCKTNVPDDVKDRLDNYIQECDNLYLQANPPPPQPNAAPGPLGVPAGMNPNGPAAASPIDPSLAQPGLPSPGGVPGGPGPVAVG